MIIEDEIIMVEKYNMEDKESQEDDKKKLNLVITEI